MALPQSIFQARRKTRPVKSKHLYRLSERKGGRTGSSVHFVELKQRLREKSYMVTEKRRYICCASFSTADISWDGYYHLHISSGKF